MTSTRGPVGGHVVSWAGRHLAGRLADEIDRAGAERLQRLARTLLGVRAEHDHRRGPARHDLAHRRRAVQARHVEVHGHHVRSQLHHLVDRLLAVLGLADHLEATVGGEQAGDGRAHEQGVVDHQHAHLAIRGLLHGAASLRGAMPSTW
jgi:hypothetical protein